MLLDKNADITAESGRHGNVLQAASEAGHHKVVQMLFDSGADVDTRKGERYRKLCRQARKK